MKAIATKQPTNEPLKQNKSGEKGRSRSVSPLSTGIPLLQRKCACGGGCPRCHDELGIQTKLKISEPGDRYEQEADRIADEVMRMPEPSVQRQEIEDGSRNQQLTETDIDTSSAEPLAGEEVRARCGPSGMGCSLIVNCYGRDCALVDCGRGSCPTCPPGFGNLWVRNWCSYSCLGGGGAFTIQTIFGGQYGPICTD